MARSRVLAVLRIAVAVVILVAVGVTFARNWSAVSGELGQVGGLVLVAALLLAVVGPAFAMLGWRVLLADLGSALPVAPAAGIFFVGQLGKYLPGSVWTVLAQAEMGARLHIPRRRSAVAGLIAIGLGVLSGLVVGLPAVPLLLVRAGASGGSGGSGAAGVSGGAGGSGGAGADGLVWVLAAVPLLLLACWPRLLNALIARGLALLRREPLEHRLSGRAITAAMALFVGSWLCFGLQTWVLAEAVAGGGSSIAGGLADGGGGGSGRGTGGGGAMALATVSGYALAASLGMLTVITPAGLGVREGLLVLLLGSTLSHPAALAVVLLSRFTITVGDLLVAAGGLIYARRHQLLSARLGHQAAALAPGVSAAEAVDARIADAERGV